MQKINTDLVYLIQVLDDSYIWLLDIFLTKDNIV